MYYVYQNVRFVLFSVWEWTLCLVLKLVYTVVR